MKFAQISRYAVESVAGDQLKGALVTPLGIESSHPVHAKDERTLATSPDVPEAKHFEQALPSIAEHTVTLAAAISFLLWSATWQ